MLSRRCRTCRRRTVCVALANPGSRGEGNSVSAVQTSASCLKRRCDKILKQKRKEAKKYMGIVSVKLLVHAQLSIGRDKEQPRTPRDPTDRLHDAPLHPLHHAHVLANEKKVQRHTTDHVWPAHARKRAYTGVFAHLLCGSNGKMFGFL